LKIRWEPSVYVGQAPVFCVVCGYQARPMRVRGGQYLLAIVYNDQDIVYGEACRSCVASGPHEIRERLQERINTLQSKLRDLQMLVAEDVQVPTLEEEFEPYSRGSF
jgi:hypothetical protein